MAMTHVLVLDEEVIRGTVTFSGTLFTILSISSVPIERIGITREN